MASSDERRNIRLEALIDCAVGLGVALSVVEVWYIYTYGTAAIGPGKFLMAAVVGLVSFPMWGVIALVVLWVSLAVADWLRARGRG
jgi:hypothetical protein